MRSTDPALLQTLRSFAEKTADETQDEDPLDQRHLGRNIAMGLGAAAPFAGMIGQGPILHDPHTNANIRRVGNHAALGQLARPGDMLLASKNKSNFWKRFIQPLSGSEFYHSQPVVDVRSGKPRTVSAAEYSDKSFREQSFREIKEQLESLPELGKNHSYGDMVLLRPKTPLTPDQLKTFRDEAINRSRQRYGFTNGVGTWLREVFVPKFKFLGRKTPTDQCIGNTCGTTPAFAYEAAGRDMIKGKTPNDAFPTDWLRSDNFTPVGAMVKDKPLHPFLRRALPIASRAALGAGLAGSAYAISKDPYAAAAPLGVMAGAHLADKLFDNKRSVLSLIDSAADGNNKSRAVMVAKALGMASGGAAAYYGSRALGEGAAKYRDDRREDIDRMRERFGR